MSQPDNSPWITASASAGARVALDARVGARNSHADPAELPGASSPGAVTSASSKPSPSKSPSSTCSPKFAPLDTCPIEYARAVPGTTTSAASRENQSSASHELSTPSPSTSSQLAR